VRHRADRVMVKLAYQTDILCIDRRHWHACELSENLQSVT
jgi:hypothetical protein